ncbi:MAG: sigma 54-interacting transcriptional regulator [Bacillota bacterium]|nr:sigma 54-interacting transcriptional regulator [Bacillota bacterium]
MIVTKELIDNIDVILDATYDDLLISDGEGKIIAVNSSFEKGYGLTREETLGKTVFQLEKEGYFKPSIVSCVLKEKRRISMQQENNVGRVILVTAMPIFDDGGKICFVVSYSRDITEMVHLEEQVKEYSEELNRLRGRNAGDKIIAESEESREMHERLSTMAAYDANLILTGPSGSGKTMYARLIHQQSGRLKGPFIEVNCAAIPETLLESELFGYERGAFTGASEKGKAGFVELADKGTLFLDEISELPLSLQVKLLKVIQDKVVTRVGGIKEKKVDFRLIAATNKDLTALIKKGIFREDLYYRINVLQLDVLPLAVRKDDILPLAEYFLQKFNTKYGQHKTFSSAALKQLQQYNWPGNVRELSNVVERSAMMTHDDIIKDIAFDDIDITDTEQITDVFEEIDLNAHLETIERKIFRKAWKQYRSSTKVANALSVSQPTAYRKIKKYCSNYSE